MTWAELRDRRGLSQATLASRAGLSTATIYLLESGKTKPHRPNRIKLAEVVIDAAPLDHEETEFLVGELDIDRRTLQKIQRDITGKATTPHDAPRARIYRVVDQLIDEHGIDKVRRAMVGLSTALGMLRDEEAADAAPHTPPHSPGKTRVLVGPPVPKTAGGTPYIERVEVEYEEDPRPPRAAPAAQPTAGKKRRSQPG